MNLSVGIIGLPNVGKSTLFNALLKKQAAFVANFPFATIEPNVGVVPVPDSRLERLVEIISQSSVFSSQLSDSSSSVVGQSDKQKTERPEAENRKQKTDNRTPPIVPATVKFVDIAGLVKGASEGAGLGNKFLSHIREVSIIAHVVRAFDPSTSSGQEEVIRVGTNPKEDYQTIQTELILADLETLAKSKTAKKPSILSSIDGKKQEVLEKIHDGLNRGIPVREIELLEDEKELVKGMFFLSKKPEIVVLNVSEQALKDAEQVTRNYAELLRVLENEIVVISAKIESELSELLEVEQKQYLKDLGLKQSGLERLIQKAYETLGLISFLTAGEKEVRAWTIKKGSNAQSAAGEIHTDFIKKFIKAEVVSFEDFVSLGGWKGAREKGRARMEGRDYIVQDGDVVEFKIGS